ncbi:MAG: hypothetical protein V4671_32290 [Armatimonadota bacterium]
MAAEISQVIGFDIHEKDFDELVESAQKLTEDESLRLLEAYRNTDAKELGRDGDESQQARVYLIRFLVALFPRSQSVIEFLLSQFRNPEDYEIHFTLFCYLDDVPYFGTVSDRAEVLRIMENYLMTVPADTGHASWMAGDMLSDHWEARESLPVLLRAAQKARFISGRSTGLDGLELQLGGRWYDRESTLPRESKLSTEEEITARRVLRAIVRKERNPGIRSEAARLLKAIS